MSPNLSADRLAPILIAAVVAVVVALARRGSSPKAAS